MWVIEGKVNAEIDERYRDQVSRVEELGRSEWGQVECVYQEEDYFECKLNHRSAGIQRWSR
jgi:hypothetical protein